MFEDIPSLLTAEEILDAAFRKANKLEVPDPDKYHRVRKTEEVQMRHIMETCAGTLERYHSAWPNLDRVTEYEREVLDLVVGLDDLKKSLSRINWAAEKLRDLHRDVSSAMRRERTTLGIQAQKRRFSGRAGSVMKDIDPALNFLRNARDATRILPTIHAEYPTVVIAGFPNVGKSSLLAAWTKAHPEIAAYSFTTKSAEVGHFPVSARKGDRRFVQVVDTPGLLDRPDAERNAVEKHALAALRHAADAVLFLMDPTETAGYSVPEQESLLHQVRKEMAGLPLVVAYTKSDMVSSANPSKAPAHTGPGPAPIPISPVTGAGLDELKKALLAVLPLEEPELERDPLELWKSTRDPLFQS